MRESPLVSVVVTTRNSKQHITVCLTSIQKQIYKNTEIIVVDNNSSDETKKIALCYTKKVFNHGQERSSQRNFGARQSKGEYLLFIDSDMYLDKKVIEESVNVMQKKPSLVALYIPEIIFGSTLLSTIRNFERSFYNQTPIDAVRFVRKHVFEKIGGFDENLYAAEDWDITKRLKKHGKTAIISHPLFHDESSVFLLGYLKKKAYYARNIQRYRKKWGRGDSDIIKQLGLYYRFCGVFIENGKWRRLILHPCMTIGMISLKLLVGVIYLVKNKIEK